MLRACMSCMAFQNSIGKIGMLRCFRSNAWMVVGACAVALKKTMIDVAKAGSCALQLWWNLRWLPLAWMTRRRITHWYWGNSGRSGKEDWIEKGRWASSPFQSPPPAHGHSQARPGRPTERAQLVGSSQCWWALWTPDGSLVFVLAFLFSNDKLILPIFLTLCIHSSLIQSPTTFFSSQVYTLNFMVAIV